MTDTDEKPSNKKSLTLSPKTLTLKKGGEGVHVRQSFTHGRSKTVTVEVKKKRVILPGQQKTSGSSADGKPLSNTGLTPQQVEERLKALHGAMKTQVDEIERVRQEFLENQALQHEETLNQKPSQPEETSTETSTPIIEAEINPIVEIPHKKKTVYSSYSEEEDDINRRGKSETKVKVPVVKRTEPRRNSGKLTVVQALSEDQEKPTRSLAAMKRQREKRKMAGLEKPQQKVIREVIIPEVITVQELANRLAERSADVIKALMKMDVMATITQAIDGDTAELIASEFGHQVKRVSESDIEIGLHIKEEDLSQMQPRPPVVTVMGHVDHGKTSLLDALKKTDVAAGEAGGITQHIGAYQVSLSSGEKITFIDTPGHAAFTEMRARGANVTDIVVLVVAADDGVKDQTIEAIHHAKAANVPIIIAINKIDKPDADPERVRNMLMQHEIFLEKVGGDILDVEVSAKQGINLDKLEEVILLQAEILDLKANPNRLAEGVVVESRLERGRGIVSTVLVQKGTLKVGDLFVAGAEYGRVRALIDDRRTPIDSAGPSVPVEVLGFNGPPMAGDSFIVVDNENRAREISEFRQRRTREAKSALSARGTMEQMFLKIAAGEIQELPLIIKSDVQGSMEAISGSLTKLSTDEVKVNILHSGVGEITESDVTLAKASQAMIIGFNVRANPQARDAARKDSIEIRYYSIIYDVLDDVKAALGGLLAPTLREKYLGSAAIRNVFTISKIGKIAGCMVTEGIVKRGAKVRLLRDNIVIHEGVLKTLKRFKDEVKEAREGYECGMAFENYNDIKVGDTIECFEIEEIIRTLD
ncbi:MAG: translation initiation factor IF-2 [Alphaproteobacteria bacterium]|nr:translation initiation factor IF-2 [Alphaproteobacteria bacterium]MBP7729129.1 translation initiation factor IF-2 [Alphaproteobacteria bacterium]